MNGFRQFCLVLVACLFLTAGVNAVTTVEINPSNQTGGNINDLHIYANKTRITDIDPNPVPPFTVTNGVGSNPVVLSGGTLANGGSITAILTLVANKAGMSHYRWTINSVVIGSSIMTYSGVPVGVTANDCHIKVSCNPTSVRVVEPAGWTAVINGNVVELSGPQIGQGTNVKVEIYCAGRDGPIIVSIFKWTMDGEVVKKSKPVYVFNDTGLPMDEVIATCSHAITSIYPNPPLPFTQVDGLGTTVVTFSGATILEEGAGDDYGIVQFVAEPGGAEDFDVYLEWHGGTEDVPTLSEWGMLLMGLLLLVVGTVAVVKRRKRIAESGIA